MSKSLIITLSVAVVLAVGLVFAIKYLPLWATLSCLGCLVTGGVLGFIGGKRSKDGKMAEDAAI